MPNLSLWQYLDWKLIVRWGLACHRILLDCYIVWIFVHTKRRPCIVGRKQVWCLWDYWLGREDLFSINISITSKLRLVHIEDVFNICVSSGVRVWLNESFPRFLGALHFKKLVEYFYTFLLAIQIWMWGKSPAGLPVISFFKFGHSVKFNRFRLYSALIHTWLWSSTMLLFKHGARLVTWCRWWFRSLLKGYIADEIVCLCSGFILRSL